MSFSTVLIISLAAGVILIVGGGVMMYMSNLVKSAYEIKVQINTDMDDRLTKMADDLDKKSRWIKRDLLEEIDKIKAAMQTENARKVEEILTPLVAKVDAFEAFLVNERSEWVKAVEADRAAIASLETRLKATTRRRAEEPKPVPAPIPGGDAQQTAEAADATAPQPRLNGPTPVGDYLQELGGR